MTRLVLILVFLSVGFTSGAQNLARGADVGWLSEMEASNRIWRDSNGVQKDLFDILPDYCINSIRLRVWVNPTGGWSGKQDVINLAKRAANKGYRLMIDFHYSDSWADPGQQTKPAAWTNYSVAQLAQAVYDHTADVLNALKNEGITPEWVQVGNETNDGMLWPEGRASGNNNANMVNYARFVDSGYQAVKSVFPNAKVIVHVSNGYNNSLFRWNIGGLVSNGARFDIIAMSMYPDETTPAWAQYATDALANMQDMITRYNKEVIVSEIGLPTNQPVEGRLFVEQVIKNLQSLSNNRGLGVFWWEPQAYNWKGYGKVAWNGSTGTNAYRATEAMKGFKYNCQPSNPVTNVNLIFKVNMTGQNTANGVYITGDMTAANGNWQMLPMTHEGNNIYTRSFTMLSGSSGAYYYLNANDWTAREAVPLACALWWDVDRGYVVPNQTSTIQDAWASCSNIVTSVVDKSQKEKVSIYPNPFETTLSLKSEQVVDYQIIDFYGKIHEEGTCVGECVVAKQLTPGNYLLKTTTHTGETTLVKVVKY